MLKNPQFCCSGVSLFVYFQQKILIFSISAAEIIFTSSHEVTESPHVMMSWHDVIKSEGNSSVRFELWYFWRYIWGCRFLCPEETSRFTSDRQIKSFSFMFTVCSSTSEVKQTDVITCRWCHRVLEEKAVWFMMWRNWKWFLLDHLHWIDINMSMKQNGSNI